MDMGEAIEYARIPPGTFRKWVAAGRIPAHGGRRKLFHRAEVDAALGYTANGHTRSGARGSWASARTPALASPPPAARCSRTAETVTASEDASSSDLRALAAEHCAVLALRERHGQLEPLLLGVERPPDRRNGVTALLYGRTRVIVRTEDSSSSLRIWVV